MNQMKRYRVEQKNEEPVEVQIIRSSRRSMGLQVKADGTVCARVPMQVMDYAVPDRIVDYVVIHELAHRRFMNHSKAFWKEVEKYMPDYKEQKKLLSRFAIKH